MPPRPSSPPKKLTSQQFTYFCLGLPIGLIAVTVGIVGLVIVWGTSGHTAPPSHPMPSHPQLDLVLPEAACTPAAVLLYSEDPCPVS